MVSKPQALQRLAAVVLGENIVLVVQSAQEPWTNCSGDGSRQATVPRAARRSATAASARAADQLPVHELVDDMCKKAASLCAGGEILGIAVMSRG
jgi:hypothetical protein